MNLNLTENQKRILTSVIAALFIAAAALLGYEVKQSPAPTQETEIGAQSLQNTGIKCGASADPCVVSNWGRDINVYSDEQSTSKFSVDGATGNVTTSGTINGVKCYKGQQTVLGAATVIPATVTAVGITTPTWLNESFAASPGDTYWQSSHTNAAGVVTINVYQRMLSLTVTPVAATTGVPIDYEICGQ